MAKLKPELLSISKMVRQLNEQNNDMELPESDHSIWADIIQGKVFIESGQMALKLLLVKARTTENDNEAREMIQQYFARNLRSLNNEVKQIEQHLAMAS